MCETRSVALVLQVTFSRIAVEFVLAESPGGALPSWTEASGTTNSRSGWLKITPRTACGKATAAPARVAKTVGDAGSPGSEKYSVTAVGAEIHHRGEDPELVEMVDQLTRRLRALGRKLRTTRKRPSFAFTNFGAALPNTSMSRLTTAMMVMASLHWSTAPTVCDSGVSASAFSTP